MKRILLLGFLILIASACTTAPSDQPPVVQVFTPSATVRPTATQTPMPTTTPEPTNTPLPTFTPTVIPTIIGGSEPLIAYMAKDKQGNLNLYIDGFFTEQPKLIMPIYLPEDTIISVIKWSPDGRTLAFGNGKENGDRWLIVYDLETDAFQDVYKVPSGRYVDQLEWSEDNNVLTFVTANLRPPGPNLAIRRINLSDLIYLPVEVENLWINNVTRVDTQARCHDTRNPVIRRLFKAGYQDICYFPEIGLYGAITGSEGGVDYVLLSEDGQVQKTLMRFPAEFSTGGSINLLLSPDASRVLMIGVPCRPSGDGRECGVSFAIPISMTETAIARSDAEELFYKESVLKMTPPPHVLHKVYVYGWSPDGRNYLAIREYLDQYVAESYKSPPECVVLNADYGDVIYTYQFPGDLQEVSGFGYHLVWPGR